METALTFGGTNLPTLYNMVAKLLIELAALESRLDLHHNVQQLDDNCVVATEGSLVLWRYLKSYKALAQSPENISFFLTSRLGKVGSSYL